MFSFTGQWVLPHKDSEEFKFLKSGEDPTGVYKGFWEYYGKSVHETLELTFDAQSSACEIIGSGENFLGVFHLSGTWKFEREEWPHEVKLGVLELTRNYENLQLSGDESVGSDNENELFDAVKPSYMLEFEERAHIEHARAPLKDFKEIKVTLKS
jgi:hypothetical protein